MTSLAPARALHAPRARRTRPHRPRVPRADATDGSTPSRRADDAPIASKPVAVDAKPSASKALLDEVRAALVPSGANAATVLRATQRFQEAYEAGEDVETTVAKAMGFARFEDVPEAQRMYASKIAKKLEQNAKDAARGAGDGDEDV